MSGNGAPAATDRLAEPCRIVLEFGAPGSAEVAIRLEGQVATGQLYLGAWLLDAWAHQVHGSTAQAPGRILVPAPGGQLGPLGGSR